jgi:hypothetical protein
MAIVLPSRGPPRCLAQAAPSGNSHRPAGNEVAEYRDDSGGDEIFRMPEPALASVAESGSPSDGRQPPINTRIAW